MLRCNVSAVLNENYMVTHNNRKAVALMSGGLDSLLAAKVILDQGIDVEGVHFSIGFGEAKSIQESANHLGISLHSIDVVNEFRSVMLNPIYDYGAWLNPCVDCKIFMVRKALIWMKAHHFNFIITGEVLGQRPKSQRKDTLNIIRKSLGRDEDLLLRPLSAQLLNKTLPEKEGWVDREKLYRLNGRSRKPQMELAKKLGIEYYPQPAGGCLLTEPRYCHRMEKLWDFRKLRDYTKEDVELLKIGRHIWPKDNFRMIIGRNERENQLLEKYRHHYSVLQPISHVGSLILLEGAMSEQDVEFAARIAARFSKGKYEKQVEIEFQSPEAIIKKIWVSPLSANEICDNWYM